MHLVRAGNYTFNLHNVTEVVDYGDKLAICFFAGWPDSSGAAVITCRNLTGDDADAMRRYIARLADDAQAQIR